MAKIFVNPNQYPVGVADPHGSRIQIGAGKTIEGDWYEKFVGPKFLTYYDPRIHSPQARAPIPPVVPPATVAPVPMAPPVAPAAPATVVAAAPQVIPPPGTPTVPPRTDFQGTPPTAAAPKINIAEQMAPRYSNRTKAEWTKILATVPVPDLVAVHNKGQLHGVAEFLGIPVLDGTKEEMAISLKNSVDRNNVRL